MTPSESDSQCTHDDHGSPVRAGPARVFGAEPASGHRAKEAQRVPPGTEGHFWRGDACLSAKGNEKIARSVPICPGSMGPRFHVACFATMRKKSSASPTVPLRVVEPSGGNADPDDVEWIPRGALHLHSVRASFGKNALRNRVRHVLSRPQLT